MIRSVSESDEDTDGSEERQRLLGVSYSTVYLAAMLPVRAPAWRGTRALGSPAAPAGPRRSHHSARRSPAPTPLPRIRCSTARPLPPVPEVRGPLALRVVYPTPTRVVARSRLELSLRLRRHRRGPAHDQRPAGAGLAQWRLARLDFASARQPDAVQHRGTHRLRLAQTLDYVVRRGDYRPPPRPGRCGSTRCR